MQRSSTGPGGSEMEARISFKYPPQVVGRMMFFDFDDVPKHIAGAGCDFNVIFEIVDNYMASLVQDPSGADREWQRWKALSDLEKRNFESNIDVLKRQQTFFVSKAGGTNTAQVASSTERERHNRLERGHQNRSSSLSSRSPARKKGKFTNDITDDDEKLKQPANWDAKEDKILQQTVTRLPKKSNGYIDWDAVSSKGFNGVRTNNGCRNRWNDVSTLCL